MCDATARAANFDIDIGVLNTNARMRCIEPNSGVGGTRMRPLIGVETPCSVTALWGLMLSSIVPVGMPRVIHMVIMARVVHAVAVSMINYPMAVHRHILNGKRHRVRSARITGLILSACSYDKFITQVRCTVRAIAQVPTGPPHSRDILNCAMPHPHFTNFILMQRS